VAGLDGFELIPDDDDLAPSADEELNAAAASALEDPEAPITVPTDDPDPLGYSWAFDFAAGRFIRQGGRPARVTGYKALEQRCLMALYSARYAHAVFSDTFGVERPQEGIGEAGDGAHVAAEDWRVQLREALLAFDDVADVSLDTGYDPVDGVIYIWNLVVTTNEEVELPFDDIAISVED
jgi:hypothetical protein